jgi:hypothetical protein
MRRIEQTTKLPKTKISGLYGVFDVGCIFKLLSRLKPIESIF